MLHALALLDLEDVIAAAALVVFSTCVILTCVGLS